MRPTKSQVAPRPRRIARPHPKCEGMGAEELAGWLRVAPELGWLLTQLRRMGCSDAGEAEVISRVVQRMLAAAVLGSDVPSLRCHLLAALAHVLEEGPELGAPEIARASGLTAGLMTLAPGPRALLVGADIEQLPLDTLAGALGMPSEVAPAVLMEARRVLLGVIKDHAPG